MSERDDWGLSPGSQNGGGGGYGGNRNYGGGNNWNRNRQGGGGNGGGNRGNWGRGGNRNEKPFDPNNVKLYKPYVVISNKEVPPNVVESVSRIVKTLEGLGFILRMDGMEGLAAATENIPAPDNRELHLPWKGFDNKESKFTYNSDEAKALAKLFHPGYDTLKPAVQSFLAKNVRLAMGDRLKSPALFMICWSEDGAENSLQKTIKSGNIGHIIGIMSSLHAPIFNFGKPDAEQRLRYFLGLDGANNNTERSEADPRPNAYTSQSNENEYNTSTQNQQYSRPQQYGQPNQQNYQHSQQSNGQGYSMDGDDSL